MPRPNRTYKKNGRLGQTHNPSHIYNAGSPLNFPLSAFPSKSSGVISFHHDTLFSFFEMSIQISFSLLCLSYEF